VEGVRAEAPEREIAVEAGRLELDARALLHVPRSQAQQDALLAAEAPEQALDAGDDAVLPGVPGPAHEARQEAQVLAVQALDLPAGRLLARRPPHGLREVPQIGAAGEGQFPEHAPLAVEVEGRAVEALAARPADAD